MLCRELWCLKSTCCYCYTCAEAAVIDLVTTTCCLVQNVSQCNTLTQYRGCQTVATVLHSPLFGHYLASSIRCQGTALAHIWYEHTVSTHKVTTFRTAAAGWGIRSIPCSKHLLHPVWHCSKSLLHQLPCHCHCTCHRHPFCPQGSTDRPCPMNCPPHSMCCCCQVGQMGSNADVHRQCHYCSWQEPAQGTTKEGIQNVFLCSVRGAFMCECCLCKSLLANACHA